MARKETSKDRAVAARNARREERKKHESEQLTRDARLGEERREKAAGKTTENGSAKSGSASTSSPAGPSTPARAQASATPAESSSAPITSAPAFLVAFAQRINKLQAQRKSVQGAGGIQVTNSTGNTIVSGSTLEGEIDGLDSRVEALENWNGELHFNDGTIDIDIDANGIKLLNITSGDFAKVYTTGAIGVTNATNSNEVLMDPDTATIEASSATTSARMNTGGFAYSDAGVEVLADTNGLKVTNLASGDYAKLYATGAIGVTNAFSGAEVLISPADLTGGASLSVIEIDVCNSGSPGKMLVIGSAPY